MSRESAFGVTPRDVEGFNSFGLSCDEKRAALEAVGGLAGVVGSLKSDERLGLSGAAAGDAARLAAFGANRMPAPEEETWFELFVAAFDDTTVLVLCVAAAVSLAVGVYDDPAKGWIEGAAILAAVLIVAVVTATNDYQKQVQFRALNAAKDDVPVKVVRDGKGASLSTLDLVVGDVVRLETGDKVPADCVLCRVEGADVSCDESSLTGETDDVDKTVDGDCFLLSGCCLTAGNCFAVVVAVGEESQWGRIKAKLADKPADTPLQEKLDHLAQLIGYVGLVAAIATFVAMMAIWYYKTEENKGDAFEVALHAFILGVTIVVVAVPEGSSIVVAVKWGRGVFDNIRRFLQFQLTVNAVALTLTFVGAVAGYEPPLGAVQMLWVNLIMDTMGALALATEVPTHEILERRPYVRDAPLVGRVMVRNVAFQAVFQLVVLCALMTPEAAAFFDAGPTGDVEHLTLVFNAFVFCQIFNEFNARSLYNDRNVLAGLSTNPVFVGVIVFTVVLQYVIVEHGGDFAKTRPLDAFQWAATVAIGFGSMPVGLLMRSVPPFTEADASFAKGPKRKAKKASDDDDDDALAGDDDAAMAWVAAAAQAFLVLAVPIVAFLVSRADVVGGSFSLAHLFSKSP